MMRLLFSSCRPGLRRALLLCVFCLVALVSLGRSAHGSTITYTISFTASPDSMVTTYPWSGAVSASGSFTVTLDPTLSYTDSATGIAVTSLTANGNTYSLAPVFSYSPVTDILSIGGAPYSNSWGPGDYILELSSFSTSPQFHLFSTSFTSAWPVLLSYDGTAEVTSTVTPEPQEILLLGTGVLVVAALKLGRKRLSKCADGAMLIRSETTSVLRR